jgi:hypothetical protein
VLNPENRLFLLEALREMGADDLTGEVLTHIGDRGVGVLRKLGDDDDRHLPRLLEDAHPTDATLGVVAAVGVAVISGLVALCLLLVWSQSLTYGQLSSCRLRTAFW